MAALTLPSLEVQGFRGFQDLRIEKLGRVNLIVGKNNIGKSSLLEAIRLHIKKSQPQARATSASVKGAKMSFIGLSGLGKEKIAQLWSKVADTDRADDVLKAFRIVAPGIESVHILSSHENACVVRVKNIQEPIPMHDLGDGLRRVFGIALALVNAQNGILLIDEIENGLHYSVQEDLWRLIFKIARQLNVQIFATTHSWDCITAFQHAVQAEENEEGVLIRLEYKKEDIVATLFDKRKLAIATRAHIEVR